jgi:hypothetical protein
LLIGKKSKELNILRLKNPYESYQTLEIQLKDVQNQLTSNETNINNNMQVCNLQKDISDLKTQSVSYKQKKRYHDLLQEVDKLKQTVYSESFKIKKAELAVELDKSSTVGLIPAIITLAKNVTSKGIEYNEMLLKESSLKTKEKELEQMDKVNESLEQVNKKLSELDQSISEKKQLLKNQIEKLQNDYGISRLKDSITNIKDSIKIKTDLSNLELSTQELYCKLNLLHSNKINLEEDLSNKQTRLIRLQRNYDNAVHILLIDQRDYDQKVELEKQQQEKLLAEIKMNNELAIQNIEAQYLFDLDVGLSFFYYNT